MDREYRLFVRPVVEVVLEGDAESWSAYSDAFPGAIGTGQTPGEALQSVEEALSFAFDERQRETEGRGARVKGTPQKSA